MDDLWEGLNDLWEGLDDLWEGLDDLREGLNELWEGLNDLWEGLDGIVREYYSKTIKFRRFLPKNVKKLIFFIIKLEQQIMSKTFEPSCIFCNASFFAHLQICLNGE